MLIHGQEALGDEAALREGLEAADPATLLLSLVQLTGERHWLDEARPFVRGPMNYQTFMPEDLRAAVCARMAEVLADLGTSKRTVLAPPDDALLSEMMSLAAGETVADDYIAMMREDLTSDSLASRILSWRKPPDRSTLRDSEIVIIGAGMSGLYAAIQLREAGLPFVILEKNDAVGGTWYENVYPGCGVDTPNHFYSYAFAPNHDWSHYFAKRDELWRYFERIAEKFDLRAHIRFGTEVSEARFDEERALWRITARRAGGETVALSARVLISAVGVLNRPKLPDIAGLASFSGPAFHTAQWERSFDWRGKRVAMIGTGASGHQVGPTIAPDVARLMIFQRSPHWVVPNPNYHEGVSPGKKWALAHIPFYLRWYRFQLFWGFADGLHAALTVDPDWPQPERALNALNEKHRRFMVRHMREELADRPDLLEKVVPDYPAYGKRILIDNHWFRMLKRDNVDLVTDQIEAIEPRGVRTGDGKLWETDALVLATGFKASQMLGPMKIFGRHGRELHEVWGDDDARAYLGLTVPAFPNFFILTGPNTGLAHGGNQIFMTECGVRQMMPALRELYEGRYRTLECRAEVYERYNRVVDERHGRMVWTHKGMTNWYRNRHGRVFAISPWRLVEYWKMTSRFDAEDYELR
ncbi:flavin-containing monooxygenase [Bradyrhizobium sp.]|uniref:flavin-containing monooxygenase n=1 Tax=Bradyrhizobium sp. TaxID=376 RepID=UPI0025BBF117|nr:NAD(P)/FAD-dependent oxidoreductase [Bradyrhizobium sp.]MBV8918896.1 NAD(P)-binding domain-containing protein [Bradyrhizobium sp.]